MLIVATSLLISLVCITIIANLTLLTDERPPESEVHQFAYLSLVPIINVIIFFGLVLTILLEKGVFSSIARYVLNLLRFKWKIRIEYDKADE